MHVLILDDDERVVDEVRSSLDALGQTSDWLESASTASQTVKAGHFDVVVLDPGLENGRGLQLLQQWRREGLKKPALLVGSRASLSAPELDISADDVLEEPFQFAELLGRLHALLQKASGHRIAAIEHGPLRFDPADGRFTVEGRTVPLSRQEQTILRALLEASGRVLSADQLQDELYGWSESVEGCAVVVHIDNLRARLGHHLIETVPGLGYRLCPGTSAPRQASNRRAPQGAPGS